MDAKPAAPLKLPLFLTALCVCAAVAGITWQAWDMFGPARRTMLQGWDESFYYLWLPTVVIDGDLDFTNQIEQSTSFEPSAKYNALTMDRTSTGSIANKYPPGWAIGSLPFFLLAHALAPAGSTGLEPLYVSAVWLGQFAYAIAGLWLAIAILRSYFPLPLAWTAVLVVWLASPLVYYQSTRLAMSHSQVFTLAIAIFWLALKIADGGARARDWALLGFLSALLIVTRNLAALYLVLPAAVVLRHLRTLPAGAALIAGAALPLAAQIIAWKILFGSWFVYSYGGERFDFAHLHLAEIFFSPLHGWFYWHPLLLPAFVAFAAWGWRRPEARAWLASFVSIAVLNAAWPTWWLGSSFGHRGFEVPVFFAMIGFAVLLQRADVKRWSRRTVAALATAAIVWNFALLALFLTNRIPRQSPVTYRDACHALVLWIWGYAP